MLNKASSIVSICVIIFTLLLATASAGQTPAPAQATPSRKAIDLVSVYFTADDGHGTPVAIPSKDSLQLREDGRPQTIQHLGPADLPLTLGVLVDTSGMMQSALPAAKAVA